MTQKSPILVGRTDSAKLFKGGKKSNHNVSLMFELYYSMILKTAKRLQVLSGHIFCAFCPLQDLLLCFCQRKFPFVGFL